MERRARLEGRRGFTLHGTEYVILYIAYADAPDDIVQMQYPVSDVPDHLRVGETLLVQMLFNVPTGVRRPQEQTFGSDDATDETS
jgi:hypothetical protein